MRPRKLVLMTHTHHPSSLLVLVLPTPSAAAAAEPTHPAAGLRPSHIPTPCAPSFGYSGGGSLPFRESPPLLPQMEISSPASTSPLSLSVIRQWRRRRQLATGRISNKPDTTFNHILHCPRPPADARALLNGTKNWVIEDGVLSRA